MKVNNSKLGGAGPSLDTAKAGKSDTVTLKKDFAGAASRGADQAALRNAANVNVSERAQMMAKAKEMASSPMTVDEAKVARLQKMIDEGTYKVDADKIADRLVEEHLTIPD